MRTPFDDMGRALDSLGLPESYELVWESRSGSNPSFFGHHPTLTRQYRSPDPIDETCELLISRYGGRAARGIQRESRVCAFGFRKGSGLLTKAQLNFSYDVLVQAVAMVGEPYTRVTVRAADVGL